MSSPASFAVTVLGWIVALIVGGAIQSAYYSGILDIANGQHVTIGSFFKPRNVGNVVIASLIVGILTSIGFALCVLPGVVVAIFTLFTVIALLDRNLSAIDAIKTSIDIAKNNFVQVLLTVLVVYGSGDCWRFALLRWSPCRNIIGRSHRGVRLPEAHRRPGGAADPVITREARSARVRCRPGRSDSLRRSRSCRKLRPIGLGRRKGKGDKSASHRRREVAIRRLHLPQVGPICRRRGRLRAGSGVGGPTTDASNYTAWFTRVLAYVIDSIPVYLLAAIGVVVLIAMQKIETVCHWRY